MVQKKKWEWEWGRIMTLRVEEDEGVEGVRNGRAYVSRGALP